MKTLGAAILALILALPVAAGETELMVKTGDVDFADVAEPTDPVLSMHGLTFNWTVEDYPVLFTASLWYMPDREDFGSLEVNELALGVRKMWGDWLQPYVSGGFGRLWVSIPEAHGDDFSAWAEGGLQLALGRFQVGAYARHVRSFDEFELGGASWEYEATQLGFMAGWRF